MINCEHAKHDFGPKRDPITGAVIAEPIMSSKRAYGGMEFSNTCNRCGTVKTKVLAPDGSVLSVTWSYPSPLKD